MPKATRITAQELLELHLQHELNQLDVPTLTRDIRDEVDILFRDMGDCPLNDVVSAESVLAVIRRNVIELDIPGAIPELAGELARGLYESAAHRDAKLSDLITHKQVEGFVDEGLLLKSHRDRMISHVLDHPIYADLVSNILYNGIVNYIYEDNLLTKNVPGVGSMLKFGSKMLNKAVGGLDTAVEKNLKAYIARNIQFIVRQSETFLTQHLTNEQLKESVMDVWAELEGQSLAELQEGMGDLELNEFILLGYEFWLAFRQTAYFEQACRNVVEGFFERYGTLSIRELAADMGVTPDRIMAEAEEFLPRALDTLITRGWAEGLLRRRLERFYLSAEVTGLLG